MTNYTFADLLHIFYRFHQDPEQRKTQEDLAHEVGVALRTINNWFAGEYVPRSRALADRLVQSLGLTTFQADLMLYSINPKWVRYGTPPEVLESAEVVRYREEDIPYAIADLQPAPSIAQIESEWRVVFHDTFEHNYRRWGLGTTNDGTGEIERRMEDGRYVLTLRSFFHGNVFMGGDSHCFAPDMYYLSVYATMIQRGTEEDGYALIFEEVSDGCHAVFRIREAQLQASVVQTFNGGDRFNVYLRRASATALRPGVANKIAILAIHHDHWFYINNQLIGQCTMPRLVSSRLDVGIIAAGEQAAICHFRNFQVFVPQATRMYPRLEQLIGMPLE